MSPITPPKNMPGLRLSAGVAGSTWQSLLDWMGGENYPSWYSFFPRAGLLIPSRRN